MHIAVVSLGAFGHVNPTLSFVTELVKRGVDPKILTPVGVGGSEPIAGKNDRANWWKNRRVEFIIRQ